MSKCQIVEKMSDFYKFHGSGNDFIMLDGRQGNEMLSPETVAFLCHRHFGIGADGLIVVALKEGYDFEMIYFNSDGSPALMCGNGARCAAAFASMLGISGKNPVFLAGDGPHRAKIIQNPENDWIVEISMGNVLMPLYFGKQTEINTGTPHLVNIVDDVNKIDVIAEGRRIRYSDKYSEKGINVDWLGFDNNLIKVRTYERGVENETLSCGTGVTACAVVAALATEKSTFKIETRGGLLSVSMKKDKDLFRDIVLTGPVKFVFKGEINLTGI
jgi:diaminopimelate epimerase